MAEKFESEFEEESQMEVDLTSLKEQRPRLASSLQELRARHEYFAEDPVPLKNDKDYFNNSIINMVIARNFDPFLLASTTPLKALERISLDDLRLAECRRKGYLILRTLETATKKGIHGISTIVEDHKGNVVIFHAYNLAVDQNDILPAGTVFVLKEAYINEYQHGECMLRCESPSDIIVLYEEHEYFTLTKDIIWRNSVDSKVVNPVCELPKPSTAKQWEKRGHLLLQDGKFDRATRCYLLGLQHIEGSIRYLELRKRITSTLSAVYFQQGLFDNALTYSRKLLKLDTNNKEALILAGRSCYHLRKFKDAHRYFTKLQNDDEVKQELLNCKDRIAEQENGVFDMYKMFTIRKYQPLLPIDCADYTGPIETVKVGGGGRAMIATRDLEPGTLLVVSKALAFSWRPPKNQDPDHDFQAGSVQDLTYQLAQLIIKNPKTFGPIIYDLNDGKQRVEEEPPRIFCNPESMKEPIVDVHKLKNIILTSIFGDYVLVPTNLMAIRRGKICRSGFGLFEKITYFNRSCVPNAFLHEFNDVVFVRSIKFIRAGEEIFLPDISWDSKVLHRPALCTRRGFPCPCRFCYLDGKMSFSVLSERRCIMDRFIEFYKRTKEANKTELPSLIDHMQKLLKDYERTYKSSEPFHQKPDLSSMYALLSVVLSEIYTTDFWNPYEQMKCLDMTLRCLGFDSEIMLSSVVNGDNLIGPYSFLNSTAIAAVCTLIKVYDRLKTTTLKKKWIQILCALEKVYSGGNIRVVIFKYFKNTKQPLPTI